jgi:hypothetical protein
MVLSLTLPPSLAAAQDCSPLSQLVAPRATGYRYLIVPDLQTVPLGWNEPGFNDNGWQQACAPFGLNCSECTGWARAIILVRKWFDAGPSACNMVASEATIWADDYAQVWINGVDASGLVSEPGCGGRRIPLIHTPVTALGNLLALQGRDYNTGAWQARLDIELRGGCCGCRVVGSGHPGGGLNIGCVTAPRVGSVLCISFSDPMPAGFNLLLVGPGPVSNPPIPVVAPGVLCAPMSLYVALPVLVMDRTGNPVAFCIPLPPEPGLVGQVFVAQGAALETSGCLRATDGLRVTLVP